METAELDLPVAQLELAAAAAALAAHSNGVSAETPCSRCKKPFEQRGPTTYKLCGHCRELQRERSKRWKQRLAEKTGVCTRCGHEQPADAKHALCGSCRSSLRKTKTKRLALGRCVHCSGPNTEHKYRVCLRCRQRDRLRRSKPAAEPEEDDEALAQLLGDHAQLNRQLQLSQFDLDHLMHYDKSESDNESEAEMVATVQAAIKLQMNSSNDTIDTLIKK